LETTVNGVRLFHELIGPSDAPALVALHGGPGVGDSRDQARDLAPLGDEYTVLTYDARGSGRSADGPPYTHAQWVDDLDSLTRALGIERFALLGHSYGGILAQEYALAHQDRLTRLLLVDTTPSSIENAPTIERALAAGLPGIEEAWLYKLFEGRLESNAEFRDMWELLLPLYYVGEMPAGLAKQLADDTYFHYATHNVAFSAGDPRFDLRPRLGEITVPVLAVCGANDWITPLALSEEIVAAVADGRVEVFSASGHMPMLEEPERFVSVVRAFLAEGA
jgi:proline iminopeptidase